MPVFTQTSVRFGQTISYTKTLMGTIQSASLIDIAGNVMPLSDVGNSSATLPDLFVDGQKCLVGIATLRIDDGTITSTTAVTVLPPVGYGYTTLIGGFLTNSDTYTNVFTEVNVGDQFVYKTDEVTLLSDGSILTINEQDNTVVKIPISDGVSESEIVPFENEELMVCLPWRIGTKGFRVCRRISSNKKIRARKVTNYVYE